MIQFFVFLTVDGIFLLPFESTGCKLPKWCVTRYFTNVCSWLPTAIMFRTLQSLQIQFRKRMQTVRNIFMNQILIIDHIARIVCKNSWIRREPNKILWVVIRLFLSNNDNWILPPPTSTKSVPFWISLWNELGCNAMAL